MSNTQNPEFIEILWITLNPDGVTGRERSILNDSSIKEYYENWGQSDDLGHIAIVDGKMVGAVWSRIKSCVTEKFKDYPELGIGVLPKYQNMGIGSILLKRQIELCRGRYRGIRLGINEKAIRVLSFYENFGFIEYEKYKGHPQLQLTF